MNFLEFDHITHVLKTFSGAPIVPTIMCKLLRWLLPPRPRLLFSLCMEHTSSLWPHCLANSCLYLGSLWRCLSCLIALPGGPTVCHNFPGTALMYIFLHLLVYLPVSSSRLAPQRGIYRPEASGSLSLRCRISSPARSPQSGVYLNKILK